MADYVDRLNERVAELGTNARRLALKLGLQQSTVHRYLTRGASPKPKTLSALASALGVTVDWLLNGDEAVGRGADCKAAPRVPAPHEAGLGRDITEIGLLMGALPPDMRNAVIRMARNLCELRDPRKLKRRKKKG